MNEQWIKDLQEKLDGYGKPAPQGLWNDISNAMARQQPRKTVMPLRRKVAMWSAGLVAAAAITLAIVIGDLLPGMFKYDTEKTEQTAAHAKENKTPATTRESLPETMKNAEAYVPRKRDKAVMPAQAARPAMLAVMAKSVAAAAATADSATVCPEKADAPVAAPTASRKRLAAARKSTAQSLAATQSSAQATVGKHNENRISVSISAANLFETNKTNRGYGTLRTGTVFHSSSHEVKAASTSPMARILAANSNEEVNTRKKHKLPIKAGLSVRYKITPRLSLESGVTYSYLSSELTAGSKGNRYETDQTLQYIGIPLKVNYSLWGNRYWEVYMSAGGEVEKCVAGKSETNYVVDGKKVSTDHEDVKVKPLQCSLNAAAGLQFNILPNLGVYAEPGVGYYFNNGSKVETIYKEKPFNFNLKAGLRLSF